jgi:hypothetical protein
MSEPIDLTSRVLEEIRDELRGLRGDVQSNSEILSTHTQILSTHTQRMELVETTLRDLAEQIVMMTRGLKSAIEARARDDARLEDHEQRLRRLEAQVTG